MDNQTYSLGTIPVLPGFIAVSVCNLGLLGEVGLRLRRITIRGRGRGLDEGGLADLYNTPRPSAVLQCYSASVYEVYFV